MKLLTYFALVSSINAGATEDEAYNSSYEDCLAFAATFDNTCADQTTQQDYSSLATATISCTQSGDMRQATCPSHGTKTGDVCTFTRKLCVTCAQAGDVVTIRA